MGKIILLFIVVFSNDAFALRCVLDSTGAVEETDSVGEVLIPQNSQNGKIIWRSKSITKTVKCNDASPTNARGEYVYVYYFPDDNLTLPKGIRFGITYNGKLNDLELSSTTDKRNIKTDIWVVNKYASGFADREVVRDITFELYIKKTGTIDTSGFSGKLPIFQLDGAREINKEAPNYKYYLKALNNISEVTCSFAYKKKSFNININNDLTKNLQPVIIGNYVVTCSPQDKMKGRFITYSIPSNSDKFSTNLDGLNYNLYVKNSVQLDNNAKAAIEVYGLFKLDYNNQDWLYDSNSRVTIAAVTAIPNLEAVN